MTAPATLVSPHDLDAEKAVLGAILIRNAAIGSIVGMLEPRDFFRDAHQRIYAKMLLLHQRQQPIDLVLLKHELGGDLEQAGGLAYIASLTDGVPHSSNIEAYAHVVLERSLARAAIAQCNDTLQLLHERPALVLNGLPAKHRAAFDAISARGTSGNHPDPFRSPGDVAVASAPTWRLRGFIVAGGITKLDAKPKCGKTTLMLFWTKRLLDGDLCFGETVTTTPVVYLTEQSWHTFKSQLRGAGLEDREQDLAVLSRWDAPGLDWPAIVRLAEQKAEQIGAKVIFVDTLSQFAGLREEGENSSGGAHEAYGPLQALAAKGLAVVVARHERKAGGEVGESARGSDAFSGVADIILALRRPEGNQDQTIRVLEGIGRFAEVPGKLVIQREMHSSPLGVEFETNGIFKVLGTVESVRAAEARAGILRIVPASEDEAMTAADIIEALKPITRPTITRELQFLSVSGGPLGKTGNGKKGNPFRYFRPEKDSSQTPQPIETNESVKAKEATCARF